MIDHEELKQLLVTGINATIRAGALIMKVYNSNDFQVNLKSDATPLTLADRKAHKEIMEYLTKTRIPVMSEEGRDLHYEERRGWEYFWLVDPLDGTKEFIKRNGEFTVNIALVFNGAPIIGIVYVPVIKQLYFAMQTQGSFRIDNIEEEIDSVYKLDKLTISENKLPYKPSKRPLTIVVSRSHPSKETQEFIDKMREKHDNIELIARGSSLKICMVAEGNADLYPRYGKTAEWDTAAGQAVAEMAGCEVVSLEDGERIFYNKEDINNPWFIVRRAKY